MFPTRPWLRASAAAAALAGCAGLPAPGTPPDPRTLSASEAAAAVCSGRITSETLVRSAIERARAESAHNVFVTLDESGALAAARQADARRAGRAPCLPLQGVPIAIKDNIQVAGLPTTGGTPALRDFVPASDAPVVQRLRQAGAIVLGKTNLHELAFGISGYNPAYNTGPEPGVRNAYDVTRMAGGSSAGTAPRWAHASRRPAWGRTPADRSASPVRSTAALRCGPPWAAIRRTASCRSRRRATPRARWP